MKNNSLHNEAVWLFCNCGFTAAESKLITNYSLDEKRERKPLKDFVSFEMEHDSDIAEIAIYEEIGFDWLTGEGVTAKGFRQEVEDFGDVRQINLKINSPGGSVFDAFAIYNILINHEARIVVDIEGIAASAASFVAMSGDEIRMAKSSDMMIHKAMGVSIGNADDMDAMSVILSKLDGQISSIYAARSGRKASTMLKLMAAETWFTAEEAVEAKLADSVTQPKKKPKNFDLSRFDNAPKREEGSAWDRAFKLAVDAKLAEGIDLTPMGDCPVTGEYDVTLPTSASGADDQNMLGFTADTGMASCVNPSGTIKISSASPTPINYPSLARAAKLKLMAMDEPLHASST